MNPISHQTQYSDFVVSIKQRILQSQYEALKSVNKELIGLYWDIGKGIIEKQDEFGWGKAIVKNLSDELQNEFVGMKGFSERNLWNMRTFYMEYRDQQKLQALTAQIGWTHNVTIFQKCKDNLEREFYIKMTQEYGWTYRVLDNQISNRSYEKFLLNQTNFENTISLKYKDQAVLAVKDEYNFDFIDLLLYHRSLKSLIAVELKIGKFKPEYAGKMNFYLSALNDMVKLEDENPSIGIIICKEKNRTTVEYALKASNQPIGVATYRVTESLPKDLVGLLPTSDELEDRLSSLLNDEVFLHD